jgi:hypothetical protein
MQCHQVAFRSASVHGDAVENLVEFMGKNTILTRICTLKVRCDLAFSASSTTLINKSADFYRYPVYQ